MAHSIPVAALFLFQRWIVFLLLNYWTKLCRSEVMPSVIISTCSAICRAMDSCSWEPIFYGENDSCAEMEQVHDRSVSQVGRGEEDRGSVRS